MLDPYADPSPCWRARCSVAARALKDHERELDDRIAALESCTRQGRFGDAAVAAQIAANYAVLWHPGVFASPRLESALWTLARAALSCPGTPKRGLTDARKVMHVATQLAGTGGHSRNLWRWIRADAGRQHSVVVTRQTAPVPVALVDAVSASGGRIVSVNRQPGSLLAWARSVQKQIVSADLVILHTHNMDVIPFLALAGMNARPVVALLNHADHGFWIGSTLVDAVISSRRSGQALCAKRRGIEDARNLLLPLCLGSEAMPVGDKAQARRSLGISDDRIVLLSVARAGKFRPFEGGSLAEALAGILRADPRLLYMAVGAGPDYANAAEFSDVRQQVLAIAETPHTADFYAGADIYIDTFPFASVTSLFEAGLYRLPLLTRYEFGPGCEVLGADSIGFDRSIQRATTAAEFAAAIRRFAESPALRAAVGDAARAEIESTNIGDAWSAELSRCYAQLFAIPRREDAAPLQAVASEHELDALIHLVFAMSQDTTAQDRQILAAEIDFPAFPASWKLRNYLATAIRGELAFRGRRSSWKYLIPEWVSSRAGGWSRALQ